MKRSTIFGACTVHAGRAADDRRPSRHRDRLRAVAECGAENRRWEGHDEGQGARLDLGGRLSDRPRVRRSHSRLFSQAWFIGRLYAGTTASYERRKVNNEIWLPWRLRINASGRAFIRKFHIDTITEYRTIGSFQWRPARSSARERSEGQDRLPFDGLRQAANRSRLPELRSSVRSLTLPRRSRGHPIDIRTARSAFRAIPSPRIASP